MKCKTCDFRARKTTPACWTLFSQCGNCAYRDHPEAFARTVCKTRVQKRTFGVCSSCGNRTSKLRAYRNSGAKYIEARYCFTCKIIHVNDKEIKVEQ